MPIATNVTGFDLCVFNDLQNFNLKHLNDADIRQKGFRFGEEF